CSMAVFAAASAAICAANGVDLREPLKPTVPADCHEITLPWGSVMLTMVLLNVDLMCAAPTAMFLRSERLMRVRTFFLVATGSYLTSSFRRFAYEDPCGCVHSCACAGHAQEG